MARREALKSIPQTKLSAPAVPAGYVPRERLQALLDEGFDRRATLVCGRAGTGKTVLLASWALSRRDVAWVSLDRADNWGPRFWSTVERALDRVDTRTNGSPAHEDPVLRICERVASRRKPVVLVLDDLQEIENAVVLKELDELLVRAPEQLHVVLSSRADPRLRLHRLRLTGDLVEIRADELAFTPAECKLLLDAAAADLTEDGVEALWERTEGWAAGLRLAALALRGESDRAGYVERFAGDDRAVADYLLNEIFERQTPSRREFLLRTCVPDVLTVELAQELSRRERAGQILAELESENVLVSVPASPGGVYRYHALLRDFLRFELARTRASEAGILHHRTARWYWRHGDAERAFEHAVAGEDWELAGELTSEAWHIVIFGVSARARGIAAEIPPSVLAQHPGLALRVGSARLFLGDRPGAEGALALVDEAMPGATEQLQRALSPVITAFRLTLARLDGDFSRVGELALEVLNESPTGSFEVGRRARAMRAIALSNIGVAQVAVGELDDAELRLHEALQLARESGIDQVALNSLGQLALLEASRGRLRRAVELGTEAVEFAERRDWCRVLQVIGARLALGWAYFQRDELSLAELHVRVTDEVARQWGDRAGIVGSALLSALLLAGEGPVGADRGLRLVHGVRAELDGWQPPAYLVPLAETVEARLLAARGDLDEARRAADPGPAVAATNLRARILLASGAPADALAELDGRRDERERTELASLIEADVLKAVARRELNDRVGADRALGNALDLAGPHGYRRAFVDGGPAVRTLLVEQIRRGTDHRSLVADLIAAFDRRASVVELTRPELLEPLSDRERAVLRYLPTMMSNAEIASELFLSVNTVKTHLKAIYRKLGATRRRDAVERARRLELL